MNMIRLFGKPIRCNKSSQDKKTNEVGANLFIGNLEPEVDEKMLYDTFSAFGVLLFAKVMRDPDTGVSRGFGFISYDTFEASDAALAGMNGQFLCNRPISVSYAYKKETKGERPDLGNIAWSLRFWGFYVPREQAKQDFNNSLHIEPSARYPQPQHLRPHALTSKHLNLP
ncbi:SF3B4 [Symbiodinium microadriaticum]|nr:SF3B4 [Symbiodinium microadriaticum]